jgi:transposase
MAAAPWIVSDALWERIEPLLPKVERRFRYPGRKRLDDRAALHGDPVCPADGDRLAASAARARLRRRLDLLPADG